MRQRRGSGRRAALVGFCALTASGIALTSAPFAAADSQSATLGNVTGQISYDTGALGTYLNVREMIVRDGVTMLDQPAGLPPGCAECTPQIARFIPAVIVAQLDSSPDPEVLFNLFTGGAHCCLYSQVFHFDGEGYVGLTHNWYDPGFRLEDLSGDGLPEFVSGDARFAYAFGSFATTQFPPQIWRYHGGALTDVTRQFPGLVAADARALRRRYRRGHKSSNFRRFVIRQTLLTYTADECLLGRFSVGFKLAQHAVAAGEIDRGRRYLRNLRRFLRRKGYL